ncbi:nucleoside ABC transporter membrane protein [Breoghania corrubedonensis]|uniref:Nucleoside ABC transporter membrane protein n=1 Tax=Breoghania corrubedonensis TaxID=665038 RepID=A0A2T5V8T5_9HYPH|nr:ABC transporter permease [Breoghania corrubedonensis]PTW60134.1 nucleoside ABC transporter membrane protein [Breoghania corrubedonensis]
MRLELKKRPEHSKAMAIASPLIAIALTVAFGAILFAVLGYDPLKALYSYFIEPLTEAWSLEELASKATPLVLIAVGLSVAFLSNTWNIGAEGQYTMGAIFGSIIPVYFWQWDGWMVLPAMMIMGMIGGALYGAIPAFLKTRFGTNEILTSLMLVYVAGFFLDWLVRGPWRDPGGYNFPETRDFSEAAILPPMFGNGAMHWGAVFALVAVVVVAFLLGGTLKGFEVKVLGQAERAGAFAGFSRKKMVYFGFLLSGAFSGLAGIATVSGTVQQLQPSISPGYGFTAIIVAFLGRLNPVGILIAGLMLALTYLGGESAQVTMGISDKVVRVFQGMLLFFVLACDTLILYRISLVSGRSSAGKDDAPRENLVPAEEAV